MINRRRFSALIEPHMESLYRQAWRLCGNTPDAEDLLQELMIKIYPRLDEAAKIDKLRPWMARILFNLFIDGKRRNTRSPLHLVVDNNPDSTPGPSLDEMASSHPGPEQCQAQDDSQRALLAAVARLNDEQRQVLTLHDMEGFTLLELSGILDCPLGTLKSRLHRAREKVKQDLGLRT